MDFLDRGVRRLPVAVRVVEESHEDPSEVAPASRMLVDVPAKIYPTGIIEVEAALNKPGRYAVLLTVDKKDQTGKGQVRIPLQVALDTLPPLLFIGLAAAVAAALYLAHRRFRATSPLVTASQNRVSCRTGRARRIEFRGIQCARRAREPVALAGEVETVANDFSENPGASHARAEMGIVLLTAAHIAHAVHDARGLQRFVDLQPLLEQLLTSCGKRNKT